MIHPTHTPLWQVIAAREISTQLKSKSFRISAGLLVGAIIVLVVVLNATSGRQTTHDVAVTSANAAVVERASALTKGSGDVLEPKEYADTAAAERAVRDGRADVALVGSAGSFEVVGDDAVDPTVAQALSAAATDAAPVPQRLLDPDAADNGLRQVASFVFVLLFYITALGFGMQIAASVTSEKESRVVEILAAAVPIRALLWGKVAGASVLAIGQTVVLAVVGVVALFATGNQHALAVVGPAIAWYVVFFVIGFVALASFWSVAGSLASRQQDLQATTAPLQLILFAPYLLAVTAGEGVKTVVSMLPIVSTMMMPSRLAEGDVPLWQLGVAILTTTLAAVLMVRLAARVYERTLLRTGRRIGFKEAFALQE